MNKTYQRALFLFRRDLRLEDNTGLIFALKQAKEVIPAFIFTPEQIEKNWYRSDRCLQFMIESLEDLQEELKKKGAKLYLFFDHPQKIIEACLDKLGVDLVVANRDYTPYSIERDQKIKAACQKQGIDFLSFDDALLHAPEEVLKGDRKPYTIFTPYYRVASEISVKKPEKNRASNYFRGSIGFAKSESIFSQILPKRNLQVSGGRKEALKLLKQDVFDYLANRDFPARDKTTHLSAHLKFTTCSPREVYSAFRYHAPFLRSLYWRDFFTSIGYFFPHVFGKAFRETFDGITWKKNEAHFQRWCEGMTGFPIVDAGMRELNQTGFMHNRVRMITASFLVKDLHIDWRFGEKYFAKHLIDYDPAVNNGNWQWVASTGCDAQPYFRIFNPWAQQAKFDPDAEYISRWIPELAFLPPKMIHNWHLQTNDLKSAYPSPMIDHAKEAKKALLFYRKRV